MSSSEYRRYLLDISEKTDLNLATVEHLTDRGWAFMVADGERPIWVSPAALSGGDAVDEE